MWSPKQHLLRLTRSLRRGRSVDLPKDDQQAVRVLLELVVSNQHGTLADLLEDSSFDVNYAFGRVQKTLLHIAANCGHVECLDILLKKGSNPDIADISGSVALHFAARNGQKRCVEKLLECGANPDIAGNDGATAVHWLAVNGRDEILKIILACTTRVNLEDGQGHTALHAAARNGHTKAMECLIKAGADINYTNAAGITPLHSACSNGQRHAISLLLSKGAVLATDLRGHTSIDLCLAGGYGVATELLLEHSSKCLKEFVSKSVYNVDLNISKVASCIKYFVNRPFNTQIAALLASELSDIGFKLLSLFSDRHTLVSNLMRCCTFLTTVCGPIHTEKQTFVVVFHGLEQLWKSMEDWLILLREEVDENTKYSEGNVLPSSASNKAAVMLPKMAQRLSALLNVFYQCLVCQEQKSMPQRFVCCVQSHFTVIKDIIKLNPQVIFDHFSFLFESPVLMELFLGVIKTQPFAERCKWLYDHLRKDAEQSSYSLSDASNSFLVDRNKIFEDSCSQMEKFSSDMLKRQLAIQFVDEEGVGDGVLREWFTLLSNEILNPEYCLFTQSTDGCTFQPCSNSAINPDHLSYFKFAGRILGLALYHRQLVNVSFTLSFYKHLLGQKVNYTDVASIDPEYAKNLQWILDNDVTDLGLELNFVVETDVFGAMEEIELKPNGSRISVTEENKEEYVQLVTELRMTHAIQPQIDAFMEGFSHFIPQSLIQIFTENELDLLISGSTKINIDDWKKITNYSGSYSPEHQVIIWFWDCVLKMDDPDRRLLIRFCTGRSRLPLVALAHNDLKFMVSEVPDSEDQLPTASTCMNMLKLPLYTTYEKLEEKLLIAIRFGSYGYTFT